MNCIKFFWIFILLFCKVTIADDFQASLNVADWNVIKGQSSCQLQQKIPLYGTAGFTLHSGELLRFSIREDRFKPEIIKASLSIESPSWLHQAVDRKDYLVFLDEAFDDKNTPRLSVYGDVAEFMLDALTDGLSPTFTYVRATSLKQLPQTQVALSAINFSDKYQQFVNCRKDLLPYGFKDLLEKSLFFKPGSKRLNLVALTQLREAARYVKQMKGSAIAIASDTAIMGRRDAKWFKNRAKVISAKLTHLGVPKGKINIKNGYYSTSGNDKQIKLSVFGPDALTTIYYRKGSVRLTEVEKKRLKLIVRYVQKFMPNSSLMVKSYTDSKGKRASNLVVSQKRGAEVKRYLTSQGLDEKQVKVKAYGESRPIKSNRFPKGRAQNRRVVIAFVA